MAAVDTAPAHRPSAAVRRRATTGEQHLVSLTLHVELTDQRGGDGDSIAEMLRQSLISAYSAGAAGFRITGATAAAQPL